MLNAVQAMSTGGRLTISTGQNDKNLWMTIRDTGTGMTAAFSGGEWFEDLFDLFRSHARAGVSNCHPEIFVVLPSGNGQASAGGHSLDGVEHEIERGCANRGFVEHSGDGRAVEFELCFDIVRRNFSAQELDYIFCYFI